MGVPVTDMVMLWEGLGFSKMVTLKSPGNAPLGVRKVSLFSLYSLSLSLEEMGFDFYACWMCVCIYVCVRMCVCVCGELGFDVDVCHFLF